jgi:hypothetical protein
VKDGLHLSAFPSLRQPTCPADTHDEDHPEWAWRSLDIPGESDVVVFAVALAGRLPALEALVPGSHGGELGYSGSSNLLTPALDGLHGWESQNRGSSDEVFRLDVRNSNSLVATGVLRILTPMALTARSRSGE